MADKKTIRLWLEISKSNPKGIQKIIESKKLFPNENSCKVLTTLETEDSFFFRLELTWDLNRFQFQFNGLDWPSLNYRIRLETSQYQEDYRLLIEDYLSDGVKFNKSKTFCLCDNVVDCKNCSKTKEYYSASHEKDDYRFTFTRTHNH